MFESLDIDGDEKISVKDVLNALRDGEEKRIKNKAIEIWPSSKDIHWSNYSEYLNRSGEDVNYDFERKKWTFVDRDENDFLSSEQFTQFLSLENSQNPTLKSFWVQETFASLDANNDSSVSQEEFLIPLKKLVHKEEIIDAENWFTAQLDKFNSIDADKDKFLSFDECEKWLMNDDQSSAFIEKIIEESDTNKDTLVSFDEFGENYEPFLILLPNSFFSYDQNDDNLE
ncbi:hypothetical protein B4U79_18516 [Dinothrombium tinctorium]|uniref:EF-hand domain-containing protein n=1 Tax=Dinothrombium tinctorium TaxID=1965070 RepID=A0A443QGR4_9ACAR|nr:hypothetical protein B4U79_18516 [Dinothrombium tinctorium]